MTKQLAPDQRGRVAEKIMEWGNLVFTGLVISQVVPGPPLNPAMIVIGVASIAGAYWLAVWMMKGGGV